MRLYFLLARRKPPVPSPLLVEVAGRLRARGFGVESGIPEEMLVEGDRLAPSHDLYVLKSNTELALSLAASLHAQGARILNPFPACAAAQDKVLHDPMTFPALLDYLTVQVSEMFRDPPNASHTTGSQSAGEVRASRSRSSRNSPTVPTAKISVAM